jgi:chromosome segregation ATPase
MEPNDNEVLTSESLSARNQLREMDKVVAALRSELQAARVVIQENIRVIERYEIRQEELKQQLQAARQRLFGNRRSDSASHTTACSIWGDDGQGHAEGFQELLPCNCGALENFAKVELQAAQAEIVRLNTIPVLAQLAAAQEQVREKEECVVELLALSGMDKDKIAALQREVAELKLAKDELHDQRHAEARKCDRLAAEGGIKASE